MTLIQKQDAVVAKLVAINADWARIGRRAMVAARSTRVQRTHVAEMVAAGYSEREAFDSFWQCADMAGLQETAQ